MPSSNIIFGFLLVVFLIFTESSAAPSKAPVEKLKTSASSYGGFGYPYYGAAYPYSAYSPYSPYSGGLYGFGYPYNHHLGYQGYPYSFGYGGYW